ncbi:hypothetical protein [Photobacterium kishitanii]|uniref:Uncharacterized protein n=1 Tax=Photobacterium kishitanii TaxID=318456 RepID=A0A2T3KLQ7_9GAMM|nr:hypothetical protein [Photobacterium kishitanii]PSV00631.1 hypothetical protein C9J27_05700 [Photobacterium kishitanii]
MPYVNSTEFEVKDFASMKIQALDANIEEIMLFVGVNREDLEQEKIYHFGGDSFQISGNEVLLHVGDYVVKWKTGNCVIVSSFIFETFFKIKKTKKKEYPTLMPEEVVSWIESVEQFHSVNSLGSLSIDATIEEITEAFETDRYTLIGIGQSLIDAANHDAMIGE